MNMKIFNFGLLFNIISVSSFNINTDTEDASSDAMEAEKRGLPSEFDKE